MATKLTSNKLTKLPWASIEADKNTYTKYHNRSKAYQVLFSVELTHCICSRCLGIYLQSESFFKMIFTKCLCIPYTVYMLYSYRFLVPLTQSVPCETAIPGTASSNRSPANFVDIGHSLLFAFDVLLINHRKAS